MNFENYFELLQQIEKPTFVFERFDNQEIIKLYVEKLEYYLTEKGENGANKRKIFNVVVDLLQQCYKRNHTLFSENNRVKIYNDTNSYAIYCSINFQDEDYKIILDVIYFFESKDKNLLKELYRNVIKGNINNTSFLGLIDMARMGNNNFYFNINTTYKDYFTLEIITVIHKVIA